MQRGKKETATADSTRSGRERVSKLLSEAEAILVRPRLIEVSGQIEMVAVVQGRELLRRIEAFRDDFRHLLRVHHERLPPEAQVLAKAEPVKCLTDDELDEGNLNGGWVDPCQIERCKEEDRPQLRYGVKLFPMPTELWFRDADDRGRRRCVDYSFVQDAVKWLKVLEDVLIPSKPPRDGQSHPVRDPILLKIEKSIGSILKRSPNMSDRELCAELDRSNSPRPPGAKWRKRSWLEAWKDDESREAVKQALQRGKKQHSTPSC